VIKIGILGTARVARAFFCAPLQNATIVAIASRDQSKADAFGAEFDIPRRYGTYEQLLADPDIQAVYIPLPQHLHCEYTVKAAEAGKHVLVEKPAALSVAEVQTMIGACQNNSVYLMEAFMYRFRRIQQRVQEILASGQVGDIRYIDFNWCMNTSVLQRGAFRMDPKLGGGAMYDLGIYGIDFIRFITHAEPTLLNARAHRESSKGVDVFSHAEFRIGNIFATVTVGFNSDANNYTIGGEKGSLFARAAVSGRSAESVLQTHLLGGDTLIEEKFPPENPYITELEYFARCVERHEKPILDGENSLKNLLLFEQILTSAQKI
jgi:predicted dehydrogenase